MADLGNLLGSLMSSLIRARQVSDQQTAALAELYKNNPLLQGLSVPRIRIPELTIDMPVLIENITDGEPGKLENTSKIIAELEEQLKSTLDKKNIKVKTSLYKAFAGEVGEQLELLKNTDLPVMREAVARSVQDAFADALAKTKNNLTPSEKEAIARDLRFRVSKVCIAKEPVGSNIDANIRTADVKEKASNSNVMRLKITLKEEGLEWATQASESGGVVNTLQPE